MASQFFISCISTHLQIAHSFVMYLHFIVFDLTKNASSQFTCTVCVAFFAAVLQQRISDARAHSTCMSFESKVQSEFNNMKTEIEIDMEIVMDRREERERKNERKEKITLPFMHSSENEIDWKSWHLLVAAEQQLWLQHMH